jgi:tetratricopeptide (TPR) repeat protein
MSRAVACAVMVALVLASSAGAAERRRGRGRKPAKPAASPSPAATAPAAEASPLDAAVQSIASGNGAAVESEGRARVAKNAGDAIGHAMIGLAVRARAGKARFPAGMPAPKGQDPIAWDGKLVDEATEELAAALVKDSSLAPAAAGLVDMLAQTIRGDKVIEVVKVLPRAFESPAAAQGLERALIVLWEKGQGEQALIVSDLWISRRAADPVARRAAARVQMLAGGLDRARNTARKYRGQSKDPAFALVLGEVEILVGQPAKAIPALAPVAAADRRAEWLALLAAQASGDRSANAKLKTLASSARAGEERLAELGWLLEGAQAAQLEEAAKADLAARRPVEAALALAARRRLPGAGHAITLLEAEVARSVRDYAREYQIVKSLIGKSGEGLPSQGDLLFKTGRSLFHQNRFAEAEAEWQKSLQAGKNDAELHFHRGRAYEKQGKRDPMIDAYRKAAAWTGPGPHAQRAKDALAKLGVR